jgi:DNA polymerase III subunit delta
MAKINPEQLPRALERLLPAYWLSGDEPLLLQEAADAIRAAARRQGFSERELFHVENHFDWGQVLQSANSMSLFAERKILEVRLSGKLSDTGAKALLEYCQRPSPDNLLLITSPKLDKTAQNSAYYKALDQLGGTVQVWPVTEKQLPRWVEQRLRHAGLQLDPSAVDMLCAKVEGNLLAAVQEIEKLKLLSHNGQVDPQLLASAVADNARYDVFTLLDRALLADAPAAVRNLQGLRGEGTEVTLVIWGLAREVRTLLALKQAQHLGQPLDAAARQQGVFEPHLSLLRQQLGRFKPAQLRLMLRQLALADRALKGAAKLDPWDLLLDITLMLCGTRALGPAALRQLLK